MYVIKWPSPVYSTLYSACGHSIIHNQILESCMNTEQVMSKNSVDLYEIFIYFSSDQSYYPTHYAWRNLEEETNGDGKETGRKGSDGEGWRRNSISKFHHFYKYSLLL